MNNMNRMMKEYSVSQYGLSKKIGIDQSRISQIVNGKSLPSNAMQFVAGDLSNDDLDKILSRSLENLLAEQNIESIINEFLLSLK